MAKNKHCNLKYLYEFHNSRPSDLLINTCFKQDLINLISSNTSLSYKTVENDYTILPTDDIVFVDTSDGDKNITLPLASSRTFGGKTRPISIKKIFSVNTINILTQNSETVDGTTPQGIINKTTVQYASDSTQYFII